jgi:adenosyl cobinamide kinase/adenosyl cobinamide phosphate guanylyltransferase
MNPTMNPTTTIEGALEKVRQHGPKKEKEQITVRIDKDLLDRVNAQIQQDNFRLTDLVEEGLFLALKQRDENMSQLTKQVRFMVANLTKVQQQQLRWYLTFSVLPDLGEELSPPEALLRNFFLEYLEQVGENPDLRYRAMEVYSKYGRTPEEG